MPPARNGNTYLNFLASHDGIGMRPIEGILNELQSNKMFTRIKKNNGKFSYRKIQGKGKKIYEANITLFDLLSRTDYDKKGNYKIKRFLAAHAIMFSQKGYLVFILIRYLEPQMTYPSLRFLKKIVI